MSSPIGGCCGGTRQACPVDRVDGTAPGEPHCRHDVATPCTEARHAEWNALDPRFGPFTLATLYLTHSPCVKCQDVIITEGVVRVVYRVPYRCPDLSKLAAARVEVVHLPEEQQ